MSKDERAVAQIAYRWDRTRRGLGGPSFDEFLRRLPIKVKAVGWAWMTG